MTRIVVSSLGAAALLVLILGSCGGKQNKGPVAPEGHKVCTYCCSTASTACSCVLLEVVECPAPDNTGSLPACAECRNCTKQVDAPASCEGE